MHKCQHQWFNTQVSTSVAQRTSVNISDLTHNSQYQWLSTQESTSVAQHTSINISGLTHNVSVFTLCKDTTHTHTHTQGPAYRLSTDHDMNWQTHRQVLFQVTAIDLDGNRQAGDV